ncbi:MAG: flavodoxin family protein [Desulfomonilaceae bacterium]
MRILALNSSPRGNGISKTGLLLDALAKGMREAGADVEIVQLRKKSVKNCIGCYTCWTKTPGVCVHEDDMTKELFPKWLESDIVVYATPLYHYTVNARMKVFIERTLPALEPFMNRVDGRTHHPVRQKPPKAVVLSVAGFPELSVFSYLSSYVNMIFAKGLLAEIYRPAAESLTIPQFQEKARVILDATTQAGRELTQSTKISKETIDKITVPIIEDFDSFATMANSFWKTCIQEGLTPSELQKKLG